MNATDEDDGWEIKQSPDDLMHVDIDMLAMLLVRRVERLKKLQDLKAPPVVMEREKRLVRIAETAARARVRELAFFAVKG